MVPTISGHLETSSSHNLYVSNFYKSQQIITQDSQTLLLPDVLTTKSIKYQGMKLTWYQGPSYLIKLKMIGSFVLFI